MVRYMSPEWQARTSVVRGSCRRRVVWKLDRFGRSPRELIDLVNGLRDRAVEFVSLRESIDTTTPGGKLVFHVFGAVAQFGRDRTGSR